MIPLVAPLLRMHRAEEPRAVVYRHHPVLIVVHAIAVATCLRGVAMEWQERGAWFFGFLAGSLAFTATLVAAVRSRVELESTTMTISSFLTRQRFERANVTAIAWEKAARATLLLRDGRQEVLPGFVTETPEIVQAIHDWITPDAP